MDDITDNTEVRKRKDAIANEILIAYGEAAKIHRQFRERELQDAVAIMRHGFDRILKHLLPLDEAHEKVWNEVRAKFVD